MRLIKNRQVIITAAIILFLICLAITWYYAWPAFFSSDFSKIESVEVPNANTAADEIISPVVLSRILIPAIGTDAPIILAPDDVAGSKNDWVEGQLNSGIAQYPNAITDLRKENLVLFGHSSSLNPFAAYAYVWAKLDKLKTGDAIILISAKGERINYQITAEPTVISPKQTEIVKIDQGMGVITLVTCWPPGTTQKRIYVRGEMQEEN